MIFTSTVRAVTMTSSGHTADKSSSREKTLPRFSRNSFRISYSVLVREMLEQADGVPAYYQIEYDREQSDREKQLLLFPDGSIFTRL